MNRKKHLKPIFETAALTAVIICLNLLLKPEDPGFASLLYTPYIVPAMFSAVYFSRRVGMLSLLYALAAMGIYHVFNSTALISFFHKENMLIIAASIFLIYLFGTIREIDRLKIRKIRERLKQLAKENHRLKKISSAQLGINRELEERVTRQRTTISSLYNQMHRMDSLNLGKSLDILIETVELFTGATAVTIWNKSSAGDFLRTSASNHRDSSFDSSKLLRINGSIEGWVFRNNRIVSARMINNYDHLKRMDTGRNLITMPIPINKKIWGVLNIEEMPFIRYNQYTEKLLEIIISLAEPALSRAIDHDKQIHQSETDSDTGLPLFSQLYTMLNRYIQSTTEGEARMSLLVIEMQNFPEICEQSPSSEVKKIFLNLIDDIQMATAGMAEFFMYKADNQIAVLVPGLDSDGASLLCLEILELVNSAEWVIGKTEIHSEMIIGYSSLGDNAVDADGLVKHAEHLLEIQKL
jgi:GGDEF domain-containing protein